MGGKPDEHIIQICSQEKRVLITLDLDFADINAYPPSNYHGIFVLRVKRQSRSKVIEAVAKLIPYLPSESVEKQLWIVEEDKIRIRE